MNDQPDLILKAETNSLAESTQVDDLLALDARKRRHRRPQQKRRANQNLFQLMPQNSLFEGLQVDSDIGQFRHGSSRLAMDWAKGKKCPEYRFKSRKKCCHL